MEKKKYITIAALGCLCISSCNINSQENMFDKRTMKEVIESLTTEQKVGLVLGVGRGVANPPEAAPGMPERTSHEVVTSMSVGRVAGAAADSYGIDSLGIPSMVLADGPAGLRIDPTRKGEEKTYYCTAFPTGTSLAASWDINAVRETAKAIGNEVHEYGVDVLLAPALNIHRDPLCGRNFEYYSEDPYLAGDIATAYVQGVQDNGVGVSVKHFAVNNQETMRNGIDAQVSERALREIYLKGFERIVRRAQPWTIMSSYNKINGVLASENEWLLEDVLRKEWGYEGIVMTDWWAEENGARQQAAGNDLLMPGTQHQYDEVLEGLQNGSLTMEQLNRNVERILNLIKKTPVFAGYQYKSNPDLTAHAVVARHQAEQGMVLLRNDAETLPLAPNKKVALFGIASYDTFVGGSGSGNVNRKYKVNIDEGLKAAGYTLDNTLSTIYSQYLKEEKSKLAEENFWVVPDIKEMALNQNTITAAINGSDIVIMTISRMAGEGGDRKLQKGDYYLSDTEQQNIQSVLSTCHKAGKKAILLLNMGSIIDLSNYGAEQFDAILHTWMPGQEAGNAVADILTGKTTPSGKLPMTWAMNYEDYPSSNNFPLSQGTDRAVRYEEDIFVGYRHFDIKGIKPLYPFGYGLSYTTFEYDNMKVEKDGDNYKVSVEISNTGKTVGAEVVQIYVTSPISDMPMLAKELKGFVKTSVLKSGDKEIVSVIIPESDLASFSNEKKQWIMPTGKFSFHAAASAEDVRCSTFVEVKQ